MWGLSQVTAGQARCGTPGRDNPLLLSAAPQHGMAALALGHHGVPGHKELFGIACGVGRVAVSAVCGLSIYTLPARQEKVKVIVKGAFGQDVRMALYARVISGRIGADRRTFVVVREECDQIPCALF